MMVIFACGSYRVRMAYRLIVARFFV